MNQVKDFIEYILNVIKIWVIVQPWQSGIRVRLGKYIKNLEKGIYFRIPYIDSVYVQEVRLRVVSMPVQTLTSKDNHTITLDGALGYKINDIRKLYQTIFQPETTISNIVMNQVAVFISGHDLADINTKKIQEAVLEKLKEKDFGIDFNYYLLTNFAVVRTYRLIQDHTWFNEGLKMDKKR